MGEQEHRIRIAVSELRPFIKNMLEKPNFNADFTLSAKEEVLYRYQPIFLPENVDSITKEDFKSFLLFKNNRHWYGLHRQGGFITSDMDLLRKALSILVDETIPIQERLNQILPNSGPMVPHLGRAVITAILLLTYPDKYAALNNASEAGMRSVGVYPKFERGASFGERYLEVNRINTKLASELEVDLWTLDAVWWRIGQEEQESFDGEDRERVIEEDDEYTQQFGLERYLQGFIRDNWNSIRNFDDWDLYEEDGDVVGFEYNTGEVGRIDLLAQHKTESRWLVIELKRAQSADQTIGQVQRYMGWVGQNLADDIEQVQGMVICKRSEPNLRYAMLMTRQIDLLTYKVNFDLEAILDE